MTSSGLAIPRAVNLAVDLLLVLFVVGALTATVAAAVATRTAQPWAVIFGTVTALSAIVAAPAFVILALSPPRPLLAQRSALLSSAVWFGKTIWAGAVFAASIVAGAVVGVAASRVSEHEGDASAAFGAALTASSQLILWPVLIGVSAIAYAAMGIRWIVDLGALVHSGDAAAAWLRVERRWMGRAVNPTWRDLTIDVVVLAGRVAIVVLLTTVGIVVSVTISGIAEALGE